MKFSKKEQRSAHRATVRRMAPDLFNSKVQTAHARLLRERRRTAARSLRFADVDSEIFANPLDRQADLDAFAEAEREKRAEILYQRAWKKQQELGPMPTSDDSPFNSYWFETGPAEGDRWGCH